MARSDVPLPLLVRTRALQMLHALEQAGGTPISTSPFHAFAFFANVLSPVWDLDPLDGTVLKQEHGPYYPMLQRELDTLIGDGFITVVSIGSISTNPQLPFEALLRLNRIRSLPIIHLADSLPDERPVAPFLIELASAFLEILPERRDNAAVLDAAYSNPSVAIGRVIDFAQWVSPTEGNPSWNATETFQHFMPSGFTLNRAEKLMMYMRLLKRRANG